MSNYEIVTMVPDRCLRVYLNNYLTTAKLKNIEHVSDAKKARMSYPFHSAATCNLRLILWVLFSVVGLNLDFLALNLVGFFLYSLFNACMFWNEEIQREYQEMYPGSLNPVLINDIVFSFHAFFAVVVTIVQCFLYEVWSENQRNFLVTLLSLDHKGVLFTVGLCYLFVIISKHIL